MSKFLEKINRKAVVAFALALSSLATFAEGEAQAGAIQGLDASLVTDYISNGKTQVVSVLTAGAIIVACFYIWRLIRRALNAAK